MADKQPHGMEGGFREKNEEPQNVGGKNPEYWESYA